VPSARTVGSVGEASVNPKAKNVMCCPLILVSYAVTVSRNLFSVIRPIAVGLRPYRAQARLASSSASRISSIRPLEKLMTLYFPLFFNVMMSDFEHNYYFIVILVEVPNQADVSIYAAFV
jgi:hypothetical protein